MQFELKNLGRVPKVTLLKEFSSADVFETTMMKIDAKTHPFTIQRLESSLEKYGYLRKVNYRLLDLWFC